MLLERIENNLKIIEKNINKENFIYAFLEAYEQPKATINRLKKGDYNLSKNNNELIWKKKIFYHETSKEEDVHDVIDEISKSEEIKKNNIRFIIVTDFKIFLSIDVKTSETLDIEISELAKNSNFFLPLTGLEKAENISENLIDIKAADKMGKLYDIIIKDNPTLIHNDRDRHGLNIFFTRILFCLFSEDSGIFAKSLFTKSIKSQTDESGDDLQPFLKRLFETLKDNNRKDCPEYLNIFPYVNGGLFKNDYLIPKFTKDSKKILIEAGELDWNSINPDILGSMMQAIVQQGIRQEIGMHYTSVTNIFRIIKPLFLDSLYNEFFLAKNNEKKLRKLLIKLYNTIIFDPACGSGNFLVIAFKELYKLEIEILKELKEIDKNDWLITKSGIELEQFFGIELDDYAHESAKLSLWIAQHQMNILYKEVLNEERLTLPLRPSGNIFCGNALKMDWQKFCPKDKNKNIYLIGNPPYQGSSLQNKDQKNDLEVVFKDIKNFKNLDYISCWFLKGSKYIKNFNAELAFISTTSICKGEQVSMLWPHILNLDIEIGFCYEGFKWSNNAKFNAGVNCIIVGLRNKSNNEKLIYKKNLSTKVKNINPYLYEGKNIIVSKERSQISNLPKMSYGNKPVDNGHLILSENDKKNLLNESSKNNKFIRVLMGAEEFLNGRKRYCLWINDQDLIEASSSKLIKECIEKVRNFRLKSKKKETIKFAERSHQFRDFKESTKGSIIIPRHTSERRKFLVVGFLDKETIIPDSSQAIYEPSLYVFSILSCSLHSLWASFVGGSLGSTPRYSINLCYNTFPFPSISNKDKKEIEEIGMKLIEIREKYSEKTLSQIYDPDNIPFDLKDTHSKLDNKIHKIYGLETSLDKDKKISFLLEKYYDLKNKDLLI